MSLAVIADREPFVARSGLTYADGPSARPGSRRRRAKRSRSLVRQATAFSYLAPYFSANASIAASAIARVRCSYKSLEGLPSWLTSRPMGATLF